MTIAATEGTPGIRSNGALDGVKLHLVSDVETLLAFLRWASERRDGPIAGDTESGGLSPYHHRMRLVQVGDKRHGWAFPEGWWGAAIELLRKYPQVIWHNSPYDWRVIHRHAGVRLPWEHIEDTLTAGHICDSLKLAGLKPRGAIEVDPRAIAGEAVLSEGMKANRWTWDTVPVGWEPYWCYAALDPVIAAHLWERFAPVVTGPQREAYDLEKAVTRISAGMMDTGMAIDLPYIREKIDRIEGFRDQAMAWLNAEFGISTVNSASQVMRALNEAGIPTKVWTESGNPSISKDALTFYANMYPEHAHLIKTIRYARKAGDITGKYLNKFLELHVDGVMHYTINTCRARTSRQSVTDPPMQTFDRDEPVIRGSYIPRPGNRLVSIDADQIEMRLAAHFSEDPQLIQDFIDSEARGESFFVTSASRMFGEPVSKKDPRYTHTKNASYGQIYGAGLDKAAATAGLPTELMAPIYLGFQQRYPGIMRLMNRLVREGKRDSRPHATALDGRRLYVFRGHEYAILNTMIQGSAAIILKRGLIDLDAHGFGPYLRLTIHDEFLFEFPEEIAEQGLKEATRILTDRENFRVPLTWGGKVLDHRWVKT
ncbi:MAG TPA: DNA polymerase [Pseudonocardiaceae bacterium]|nr:DNA polymerase [Pseudonocardiaceae bacterium]